MVRTLKKVTLLEYVQQFSIPCQGSDLGSNPSSGASFRMITATNFSAATFAGRPAWGCVVGSSPGFDTSSCYFLDYLGVAVSKLVADPDCDSGFYGFESHRSPLSSLVP